MPALSTLMFLAAATGVSPASQCYPYEPEPVKLSGTLTRAAHTQPDGSHFLLGLAAPICTVASASDEWNIARRGVRKIQVVLPQGTEEKLVALLGKSVQCEGSLFFAKNSAHRTAVLMNARSCTASAQ